ncbi:MAG: hypothetical protein U0414_35530 [Polyangiaceae bacterium]
MEWRAGAILFGAGLAALGGCGGETGGSASAAVSSPTATVAAKPSSSSAAPAASSAPPKASAAAAPTGCGGTRCRECTKDASCRWQTKERRCVSGDAECGASACVNRESDCPPE